MLFGPGFVLTLGRGRDGRRLLAPELAGSRQARRHPFWRCAAAPILPLPGLGFARRRYRPADPDDLPAIVAMLEERLAAAARWARVPAIRTVRARDVCGWLSPAERATVEATLARTALPITAMHGDLHLLNCVFGPGGPRLIDWEHFAPDGSFAYDYIDFFVALGRLEAPGDWPGVLAGIGPDDPAVAAVADRLDLPREAMWLYYLMVKADTVVGRTGPGSGGPAAMRARLYGVLAAALARCAAAPGSARRRPGL
jgi:hypothetical protein